MLLAVFYDENYTSITYENTEEKFVEESTETYRPVPYAEFTDLDGVIYRLDQFKGKVILLNFWASWCIPCQKEFPDLIKLVNNMHGEVILLAVSNDSNKNDIVRFLAKYKKGDDYKEAQQNIKIFWDKDKRISQDIFSTIKLPETIVINPQQEMVKKFVGADVEWNGKEMKEFLRSLIQSY